MLSQRCTETKFDMLALFDESVSMPNEVFLFQRSRPKITFTMICLKSRKWKSHKERAASEAVLRVTCGLHNVFAVLPASSAPLHLRLL